MLYMKIAERVSPKSSYHMGKKFFFYFFNKNYKMIDVR